jgi:IS30 family transposase
MSEIILTTKTELAETIEQVLKKFDREKAQNQPTKTFTINQTAKALGKAHATIKRLVRIGVIKTTKDGLIPEWALNEYLNKET